MTHKIFIFIFLQLIFIVSNIRKAKAQSTNKSPNIVWIIAEDSSPGDFGAYGNRLVNTPNIDEITKKGVRFMNAFVTGPVCSPSRTALATGMYQTSIGAFNMRYPDSLKPALPDSIHTFLNILQNHGYVTANIKDNPSDGKIDWMFQYDAKNQFNYNHWKDLARQDDPFFAMVNIHNTHRPFPKGSRDPDYLNMIKIPPYYPDNIVSKEDWSDYYQSINILDHKVARILQVLKEHHWDKNTIVVFFSDHGRPMQRAKMFNYDSGLRIPLIIFIPAKLNAPKEYNGGKTDHQLISEIDITATTLHFAGIPKPSWMQGRVFWGASRDPEREYIFSATDRIGGMRLKSRAIRSKRFKYIRNFNHDFSVNSASTYYRRATHPLYHVLNILHKRNELTPVQAQLVQPFTSEELYDLKSDPYETQNLAQDEQYRLKLVQMQQVLDTWIIQSHDQGMKPDSPAIKQAFEEYRKHSRKQHGNKIKALHKQVLKALKFANNE